MISICLNQGLVTFVDESDFVEVSKYKWTAVRDGKTFYATRQGFLDGKIKLIYMHRQLLGFPCCLIDHKNRNGLDNRRSNLRLATNAQNQQNSEKHKDSKSPHKGVWWNEKRKRWLARITTQEGKRIYIGYFKTVDEAVLAYNNSAIKHWGEFACT